MSQNIRQLHGLLTFLTFTSQYFLLRSVCTTFTKIVNITLHSSVFMLFWVFILHQSWFVYCSCLLLLPVSLQLLVSAGSFKYASMPLNLELKNFSPKLVMISSKKRKRKKDSTELSESLWLFLSLTFYKYSYAMESCLVLKLIHHLQLCYHQNIRAKDTLSMTTDKLTTGSEWTQSKMLSLCLGGTMAIRLRDFQIERH